MGYPKDKTNITCSGFISYIDSEGVQQEGSILFPCGARFDTSTPYGEDQVPYRYQILRERARLAPCCYWRNSTYNNDKDPYTHSNPDFYDPYRREDSLPEIFSYTVITLPVGVLPKIEIETGAGHEEIDDPDTKVVGGWGHELNPSFYITPRTFEVKLIGGSLEIETRCTHEQAKSNWAIGLDDSPPCNGSKTFCPYYTGKPFQYLEDDSMSPGQPILGQSVQELRSLIKDWPNITNSQQVWEKTWSVPYIWGRDFDDLPTAITSPLPEGITEGSVYTFLRKIEWNTATETIGPLIKIASANSGTPKESIDKLSPPNFPTLVNELGMAVPPTIKITFPCTTSGNSDKKFFTYDSFFKDDTKLYIAGYCLYSSANIYIINRSILNDFPELENTDINDSEKERLVDKVKEYVVKYKTLGNLRGFKCTECVSRFWHLIDGIDINLNAINKVYAVIFKTEIVDNTTVTRLEYDYINIENNFYHFTATQKSIKSIVPLPTTGNLILRTTTIKPTESVAFSIEQLSGKKELAVIYAYPFFIFDRSYERLVSMKDPSTLQDERSWSVISTKKQLVGYSDTKGSDGAEFIWRRFDLCNRILIEFIDPIPWSSIPMGIDRSWEFISFKLAGKRGDGTSVESSYKVVAGYGRKLDGVGFPIKYCILEPEGAMDFRLDPNTPAYLEVEFYKPTTDLVNLSLDVLGRLPLSNSYPNGCPGLDNLIPPSIDQTLLTKTYKRPILFADGAEINLPKWKYGNSINTDQIIYDMSIIVEIGYKDDSTDGYVSVGHRWIYGNFEIVNTWCRDVDIAYVWESLNTNLMVQPLIPGIWKAIQDTITGTWGWKIPAPWYGLTGAPMREYEPTPYQGGIASRVAPACQDHEKSYMWHPYTACEEPRLIIRELGNDINQRLYEGESIDEKYRGPPQAIFTILGYNPWSLLDPGCAFEYQYGNVLTGGKNAWGGVARVKGPISREFNPFLHELYTSEGWELPLFGNIGRDHLRVFNTMNWRAYLYIDGGGNLKVGKGWMPAVPFITDASVMATSDRERLIGMLSHGVNSQLEVSLNYYDFNEVKNKVLPLRVEGSPLYSSDLYGKPMLRRRGFESVYEIQILTNCAGVGTRWPTTGFYYNFKQPGGVHWAFKETDFELYRDGTNATKKYNSSKSSLTGVNFKKARNIEGVNETDKFKREVYLYPSEGIYKVKALNPVYSKDTGEVLKEASIIANRDGLPLDDSCYGKVYFDRFYGDIKDRVAESSIEKEVYAFTEEELLTYLTQVECTPFFKPQFPSEEVVGISGAIKTGNLFLDRKSPVDIGSSSSYFWSYQIVTEDAECPVTTKPDELQRIGFISAINIEEIIPRFMPKKELFLDINSIEFESLNPDITTNSYPDLDPKLRKNYENIKLKNNRFEILAGGRDVSEYRYKWEPYSIEDLANKESGGKSIENLGGQIGGINIIIKFKHPVEISRVEAEYSIYGMYTGSYTENTTTKRDLELTNDPSVRISLLDYYSGEEVTIIEKEEFDLTKSANRQWTDRSWGYERYRLRRKFIFVSDVYKRPNDLEHQEETSVSVMDEPIVTTQVSLSIGTRHLYVGAQDIGCGLELHSLKLNGLLLDEECEEELIITEPAFIESTGMEDEFYNQAPWTPAQDSSRIGGNFATVDTSDFMEYAGIAPYWHPVNYNEINTVTIGKLRRHYASGFFTFDTKKAQVGVQEGEIWNGGEVKYTDGTVEVSENRQRDLIKDFFKKLEDYNLLSYKNSLFISPEDKFFIENSIQGSRPVQECTVQLKLPDMEGALVVPVGTLPPGWSPKGYRACLPLKTRVARCVAWADGSYGSEGSAAGRFAIAWDGDQMVSEDCESGRGWPAVDMLILAGQDRYMNVTAEGLLAREEVEGVASRYEAEAGTTSALQTEHRVQEYLDEQKRKGKVYLE